MRPRLRRGTRGLFLSFEGIEGSGKSTQIERLASWIREQGRAALVVREPGGTALGERLREVLLERASEPIDPKSELLLYLASRAQLVSRVIRPALAQGDIVLADRFGDASVAYQGGGRGLDAARVRSLVRFATGGIQPHRTYLLDLDPGTSLARVRSRGAALDRLEGEALAFHRAVRAAYRRIAVADPSRVLVLRAGDPADRVAERIRRDAARLIASLSRSNR